MKEIYLAMDEGGRICGFEAMPYLRHGSWYWQSDTSWYDADELIELGVNVVAFPLTHETPIKIRAVWEQIND